MVDFVTNGGNISIRGGKVNGLIQLFNVNILRWEQTKGKIRPFGTHQQTVIIKVELKS